MDLATLCREWLYYESAGTRLRMAHRCAEWDGWEEGLVDSILGPEEFEHEWYKVENGISGGGGGGGACRRVNQGEETLQLPDCEGAEEGEDSDEPSSTAKYKKVPAVGSSSSKIVKMSSKLPMLLEQEKEQMLNTTGDICGGRGGELGRRLEAWLTVNGKNGNGNENGNGNGFHDEDSESDTSDD